MANLLQRHLWLWRSNWGSCKMIWAGPRLRRRMQSCEFSDSRELGQAKVASGQGARKKGRGAEFEKRGDPVRRVAESREMGFPRDGTAHSPQGVVEAVRCILDILSADAN